MMRTYICTDLAQLRIRASRKMCMAAALGLLSILIHPSAAARNAHNNASPGGLRVRAGLVPMVRLGLGQLNMNVSSAVTPYDLAAKRPQAIVIAERQPQPDELGVVQAMVTLMMFRSKLAANESTAASAVRTLNTAEIAYFASYPEAGFTSLSALGPGAHGCSSPIPRNACLLDATLGCAQGSNGKSCTKDTYKYTITIASCRPDGAGCTEYVIFATPAAPGNGDKDFCSTSDGVVRFRASDSPPSSPVAKVKECQAWSPLRESNVAAQR